MRPLLAATLLLAMFLFDAAAQNAPTALRIHPVDESGAPIQLTRVQIYLDYWGGGEKIALPFDDSGVEVRLDRDWLCGAYPGGCEDQFMEARLILLAEGYAPVASASFLWMGGLATPGAPPESSVKILFPSGAWMPVAEGETKELTVPFRRPVPRSLRFLNQAGQPVPGVRLHLSLLLASSNHCGVVEGEPLADAVSDEQGMLRVPDADAELAFEFTKARHELWNPLDPAEPMRFLGLYSQPVNTVVLRALEKRPLHLRVTGSDDLAGLSLTGCLASCPCGACCGQLAQSDAEGRIDLDEFYPEEYERLTLTDHQGRTVWQGTTRTLPADTLTIKLPRTPANLSEPVPLERRR